MNWLNRWCMERCKSNVECRACVQRECPPKQELSEMTMCSERLIEILLCNPGAVTHPNIADRIADYTGATSEDRDVFVTAQYKGTYVPNQRVSRYKYSGSKPWNAREVVTVGRDGNVITRYASSVDAALRHGCSSVTVKSRCYRNNWLEDEFERTGVTFRWADEWDEMPHDERVANLMQPKCYRQETR